MHAGAGMGGASGRERPGAADRPPAPRPAAREQGKGALPRGAVTAATTAAALALAIAAVLVLMGARRDAAAGAGRARAAAGAATGSAQAPSSSDAPAGAPAHEAGEHRYGGLPAWLPRSKPINRTLAASPAAPVLAQEGEAVSVAVAGAHALVSVVGPKIPPPPQAATPVVWPASFAVTFSRVSRSIPLRAGDFRLVDERGDVFTPRVTGAGTGAPPSVARPGAPTTISLSAVLPVGSGSVLWRPAGGPTTGGPLVTWDYVVEVE